MASPSQLVSFPAQDIIKKTGLLFSELPARVCCRREYSNQDSACVSSGLSPADSNPAFHPVTHASPNLLAVIILTIFGGMHVIAGALYALDQQKRKGRFHEVRSEKFGFLKHSSGGAYSWSIVQEEIHTRSKEIVQPAGSLVSMAALIGIPAIRCDEIIRSSVRGNGTC